MIRGIHYFSAELKMMSSQGAALILSMEYITKIVLTGIAIRNSRYILKIKLKGIARVT